MIIAVIILLCIIAIFISIDLSIRKIDKIEEDMHWHEVNYYLERS